MLHHAVGQDEQVSCLTGGVRGKRRGGVADRAQHIQRARQTDRRTNTCRDGVTIKNRTKKRQIMAGEKGGVQIKHAVM